MAKSKQKEWYKRWWAIVIFVFVGLIIIGSLLPDSDNSEKREGDTFDAITQVKSNNLEVPTSSLKGYQEKWEQEQLSNDEWKVILTTEWEGKTTNAIWKVSPKKILCSEKKEMISICSENGWAKTYSNLDYCKPTEFCEIKEVKQEETIIQQEKITLDELKNKVQSSLGSDPVNSLTEDDGVYVIKYYFEPLNNKAVDEGIVEDFAFRIMTVFLNNNVDDFKTIKIEASTTTSVKSGIISKATITKEQVLKYGADPYSIDVKDFNEFTFDESFY